jgi:hypothetical protein
MPAIILQQEEKVNLAMNSSKKKTFQNLAGESVLEEAIKLLEGLANLPDDGRSFLWFKRRFPYVLESVNPSLPRHWAMNLEEEEYEPSSTDEEVIRRYWLVPLRDTLRAIWRAPDVRTKEWGMFRITQDYFLQGAPEVVHTPLSADSDYLLKMKAIGRAELLLMQLLKVIDRTRFCANPECKVPYFVAARRSQKYCSEPCALPAQREHKRRWWKEQGSRRRSVKVAKHNK